ncbi:MAG: 30S ribosomal protein S17 [Proteobacteria bacterium]|jgi:small subunit ribosomal protein S17|nr:MAG: 30S ribosomal protein S17 [Pseudomonadota bacterium]
MATTTTTNTEDKVKPKREEMGIVLSNKMQKTIVVKLDRRIRHAKYGKFITKTKKVKAHDEENTAAIGDLVLLVATKPLSKDKRYALKTVVRKASGV